MVNKQKALGQGLINFKIYEVSKDGIYRSFYTKAGST